MAYQYGRFQQPKIGSGYRYGSGDDIGGFIPSSLAAASQQRNATLNAQHNLWAQNNANSMAMRAQQAALENQLRTERQDLQTRNRLGLTPLSDQLVDSGSAAYQTTDQFGRTPEQLGLKPVMTIGDEAGGAPADIPPAMNPFIGMGPLQRTLRPEYKEAQARLGVPSSRTRSVEEVAAIEDIKQRNKMEYTNYVNSLNISRDQKKALIDAFDSRARIQSSDPMNVGKGDEIGAQLVDDTRSVYADAQAPAAPAAPATAPAPAAAAPTGNKGFMDFAVMYRQNYPDATDEQIEQVYLSHGGVL